MSVLLLIPLDAREGLDDRVDDVTRAAGRTAATRV
jgi:hypothetical protein